MNLLCSYCGYSASSKQSFNDHFEIHNNEKPVCDLCRKIMSTLFSSTYNLKKNMRRKHHSNDRNVANFEGMAIYANNSDSDSEMDTDKHIPGNDLDLVEPPIMIVNPPVNKVQSNSEKKESNLFSCVNCELKFTRSSNLKRHIENIHQTG